MRKTTVIVNLESHLTNPESIPAQTNALKNVYRYLLVAVSVAVVLTLSTSHYQSRNDFRSTTPGYFTPGMVDSLRETLTTGMNSGNVILCGEKPLSSQFIRDFYSKNGYKPVWIYFDGLNGSATSFLYLIDHAREYGLESFHYHAEAIKKVRQQLEENAQASDHSRLGIELEMLMTDAAFRFMVNLRNGYGPFDTLQCVNELPEVLQQGMEKGRIIESILSVQPGFVEYTRLQRAAAKFVKTNPLTDQWVELKQPVEDSAIFFRHIGEVLETLGYLDRYSRERDIPQALKSFQHFHGLEPDGKPGKNTIDALSQTTLYKYKILAMNLDRLRKEQIADSNQLLVNIPAYRLTIFEGNRMVDTFRVIVGHPASPTPLLTARMERIITNPVWYVPRSITMNEILPKLKTDSNYLRRNRMKLLDSNYKPVDEASVNLAAMDEGGFNYTLRQDRGSENSLGQVKFVFSNPYAIYLHDTPGKQMFFKDLRAFSHGCIRIKDPERLAGYIIRKINSGDTDVNTLITSGTHREIDITTPLSINIRYLTCEADDSGNLYFYKDIYGIDSKELEILEPEMGI